MILVGSVTVSKNASLYQKKKKKRKNWLEQTVVSDLK